MHALKYGVAEQHDQWSPSLSESSLHRNLNIKELSKTPGYLPVCDLVSEFNDYVRKPTSTRKNDSIAAEMKSE